MHYLVLGARCLIGLVFLVSSLSKTVRKASFDDFVTSVAGMGLVRADRCRAVALLVVAVEYQVWLALAVGPPAVTAAGFALATGLLVVLAGAIARTLRRGVAATCRCFGTSTSRLRPLHIVRNIALAAVALTGAAAVALSGSAASPGAGGAVVAAAGGLLLGGLAVFLDDLDELFGPVTPGPPTTARARNNTR
ncbi:methylamine utilization protein MauE [Streptomyces sp. A73]|nr:methylamine utilization protein MauE [Streptomyces sp. A73]